MENGYTIITTSKSAQIADVKSRKTVDALKWNVAPVSLNGVGYVALENQK